MIRGQNTNENKEKTNNKMKGEGGTRWGYEETLTEDRRFEEKIQFQSA